MQEREEGGGAGAGGGGRCRSGRRGAVQEREEGGGAGAGGGGRCRSGRRGAVQEREEEGKQKNPRCMPQNARRVMAIVGTRWYILGQASAPPNPCHARPCWWLGKGPAVGLGAIVRKKGRAAQGGAEGGDVQILYPPPTRLYKLRKNTKLIRPLCLL